MFVSGVNDTGDNPRSPKSFFFEFLSDFWVCCFIRPLEWGSRKKKIFPATGSTLFRCGRKRPFGTHRGACRKLFYFFEFWPNFFYKWYSKWTRNRICEKYSLGSSTSPPPAAHCLYLLGVYLAAYCLYVWGVYLAACCLYVLGVYLAADRRDVRGVQYA